MEINHSISVGNGKKGNKGIVCLIAILSVILIAVVAFVIIKFAVPSTFDKARDQATQIAGSTAGGDDYFSLDTNRKDIPSDKPIDEYTQEELVWAMAFPDEQEKALEAIKATNEALGFSGALYSKMLETTALMGRQTEENDKYKVSWTYHPDSGLEVTYEEK